MIDYCSIAVGHGTRPHGRPILSRCGYEFDNRHALALFIASIFGLLTMKLDQATEAKIGKRRGLGKGMTGGYGEL